MRPLFTVHAGEFLVGEHIERNFPSLNVWIPAKDTGVDLLVTDHSAQRTVSLQVKLSRDYKKPEAVDDFQRALVAAGWNVVGHKKLADSAADYWVFVLVSPERRIQPQFLVIPPNELLKRLVAIHGARNNYHFYPWVTDAGVCLQGRGLLKNECAQLANGTLELGERDLTPYLGNWGVLERLAAHR